MEKLELGQIVEIQGIEYDVRKNFNGYYMRKTVGWRNGKVFNKLGIDKVEFCSKFYETNDCGSWPYAPDLESLTRCVEALVEYKPEPAKSEPTPAISGRPEPEQFGYTTLWPSDQQRDAYHEALNEWVKRQACPFLHTVKKTDWIPYAIVVEARGWKAGDKVQTFYGMSCTVVDSPDSGWYEVKDETGEIHHCGDELLFEVQATYNFK